MIVLLPFPLPTPIQPLKWISMSGYFIFQTTALIVLSIISTLAVALRLWSRGIQRIRLESADYSIVVGLVGELSVSNSRTSNVDQIFTLADVICFLSFNYRLLALGGQDHRESQMETPEINTLVLQVRQRLCYTRLRE